MKLNLIKTLVFKIFEVKAPGNVVFALESKLLISSLIVGRDLDFCTPAFFLLNNFIFWIILKKMYICTMKKTEKKISSGAISIYYSHKVNCRWILFIFHFIFHCGSLSFFMRIFFHQKANKQTIFIKTHFERLFSIKCKVYELFVNNRTKACIFWRTIVTSNR